MKPRLLAVLILSNLGLLVLIGSIFSTPAGSIKTTQRQQLLGGFNYGYSISIEDDWDVMLTWHYPSATASDVRAAAAAFNQAAAQLAERDEPFKATIVFSQPLTLDEFRTFVKDMGIAPTQNYLRGIDARGQLVALGSAPESPDDDPVGSGLSRLVEGHNPIRVVGVVSTDAKLDKTTFVKVQADPRVFALDVLYQVLFEQIREQYPIFPENKIQIGGPPLYAALENTGIAPRGAP